MMCNVLKPSVSCAGYKSCQSKQAIRRGLHDTESRARTVAAAAGAGSPAAGSGLEPLAADWDTLEDTADKQTDTGSAALHVGCQANALRSALASCRSAVSKPSVNQP
jgi:hypothetical protein